MTDIKNTAIKFDAGKPRMSLLSAHALKHILTEYSSLNSDCLDYNQLLLTCDKYIIEFKLSLNNKSLITVACYLFVLIHKDMNKPIDKYNLPPFSVEEVAKVATFGAAKYEEHNWRKGMKWSRFLDAYDRHILEYKKGNKVDDDSKLLHLAHAIWNLMALIECSIESHGINDFYIYSIKS